METGGRMPLPVKALLFDVFGTLMDWRGSIAREARRILGARGHKLDWAGFADAWRGEYQPAMEEVRSGRAPYRKLDLLHLGNLETVLKRLQVPMPDEPTMRELNLAWHRLDAWPDVPAGLIRLRKAYRIAPCSNGNIALMADLARHNGFAWDAVLGADVARDFKPKPEVYLASCDAFDLPPDQCMMCAAHSSDLAAAARLGLRTAHIARADEHGPGQGEAAPSVPVDLAVGSVEELAERLGA
jgi:2-haloacid dehalogenase